MMIRIHDLFFDTIPYTGLFLWTGCMLILIYDAVLFGVRKWPFFLPLHVGKQVDRMVARNYAGLYGRIEVSFR